ncbi:MAG: hypothetical protein IKU68_04780 [Oscillospiraceae bacterium]|nr:hypothetical protein [Oscillospiraceae bacterium]
MRKVISLVLAVLVCASLAAVAFADAFTPSVTYKDAPLMTSAVIDGDTVTDCVVVTSVQAARKGTTDITEEERDLLIEVYEKLNDGSMKVEGLSDEYVIRDLVDISFSNEGCRKQPSHNDKGNHLAQEGIAVNITLNYGIAADVDVVVMTYIDGKWAPIEKVVNNGNGSLTCTFEDLCPVLFAVKG